MRRHHKRDISHLLSRIDSAPQDIAGTSAATGCARRHQAQQPPALRRQSSARASSPPPLPRTPPATPAKALFARVTANVFRQIFSRVLRALAAWLNFDSSIASSVPRPSGRFAHRWKFSSHHFQRFFRASHFPSSCASSTADRISLELRSRGVAQLDQLTPTQQWLRSDLFWQALPQLLCRRNRTEPVRRGSPGNPCDAIRYAPRICGRRKKRFSVESFMRSASVKRM